MALSTNRKNIEPMFDRVTQIMMIVKSRVKTEIAPQRANFRQFSCCNSVIYSIFCFAAVRILLDVEFAHFSSDFLSPFALLISFEACLSFWRFSISGVLCLIAYFAIRLIAAFFFFGIVKFSNRLDKFALRASFCYNLLRHGRFLNKRLCLGPVTRPILVSGSSYFNEYISTCKLNNNNWINIAD